MALPCDSFDREADMMRLKHHSHNCFTECAFVCRKAQERHVWANTP
jgi:hypothetical protein